MVTALRGECDVLFRERDPSTCSVQTMGDLMPEAPDRLGRAKSDLDEDSDAVVSPALLLIRTESLA